MKNKKIEYSLDNDDHWPYMATVKISGNPSATPIEPGTMQPKLETVIQSWDEIAVLQIPPNVECYFGFIVDDQMQFLNTPIETTDGKFGVHISGSDATFFVFATDMKTRPTLKLIDRVNINDDRFIDLPLY